MATIGPPGRPRTGFGMPVMQSGPRVTSTQLFATIPATSARPSVPTAKACSVNRKSGTPTRAATTAAPRTGVAPRRTSDPDPTAEETLRPPEKHRDHDQKGDGVLVGVGHVAAGQRLRETDQKAGGDRAVDVAEAARHHRRERLEG